MEVIVINRDYSFKNIFLNENDIAKCVFNYVINLCN